MSAHLRGIPGVFWALFLGVSIICLAVLPFQSGEVELRSAIHTAGLQDAVVLLLSIVDAAWIFLAAITVYFWLIRVEGLSTARRWGLLIVVCSAVIAWIGAKTNFPFGPMSFTGRMGWRMGGVLPFTLPLLWFVVVVCGRFTILKILPRASHWSLALGGGIIALLTDLNLEFVAWKVRAYWIWYPAGTQAAAWPPVQNYVSWFLLAAALTYFLREGRVASPRRGEWRPIIVLAVLNGVLLCVHIAHWTGLNNLSPIATLAHGLGF